jgi:hypothetical protein
MGFPLYFGFPSEILSLPSTSLQIQQVAIVIQKKIQLIKIKEQKRDKSERVDPF